MELFRAASGRGTDWHRACDGLHRRSGGSAAGGQSRLRLRERSARRRARPDRRAPGRGDRRPALGRHRRRRGLQQRAGARRGRRDRGAGREPARRQLPPGRRVARRCGRPRAPSSRRGPSDDRDRLRRRPRRSAPWRRRPDHRAAQRRQRRVPGRRPVARRAAPPLQLAGRPTEGGVSGVLMSPEVPLITGLSQGCTPIGPVHEVTASQGPWVLAIDGRARARGAGSEIGEVLARNPQRIAGYIHAARPEPGSDRADYVVRPLLAIDAQRAIIAIGDDLRRGDPAALRQARRRRGPGRSAPHARRPASPAPAGGRSGARSTTPAWPAAAHMFGPDSAELRMIEAALGAGAARRLLHQRRDLSRPAVWLYRRADPVPVSRQPDDELGTRISAAAGGRGRRRGLAWRARAAGAPRPAAARRALEPAGGRAGARRDRGRGGARARCSRRPGSWSRSARSWRRST